MNIYLVILLIVGIVVLANLSMFAAVRGSRGMKVDWLNTTKSSLSKPFQKEDDQLNELHQRIKQLESKDNSPE